MKRIILFFVAAASIIALALTACTSASADSGEVVISKDSMIRRGSYLVNAIGCDDCHSQKIFGEHGFEVDMEHRFSGYIGERTQLGKPNTSVIKDGYMLFAKDLTSAVGPWGQSYAANISSDPTGIGNWTEEQFIRALREGKAKGLKEGRSLLPPMPWFVYRNLSDLDLKSIFAYLKTTKPIENRVPGPKSPQELQ